MHNTGDSTPVDLEVLAKLGLLPRPNIDQEAVEVM